MPLRMAVVGKGGAGKSMVAGTMARVLARRGHTVLALGTDVMPGLTHSLGASVSSEPRLAELAERDGRRWRLKKGIGPVRAVQRCSTAAPDGVRLLQCGIPSGRDLDPLLASVGAFAHVIRRLDEPQTFRPWTLLGDLAAGPGPPALNWAPYANTWLIIVEPTWKSVLTARRIARIAGSRPGSFTLFVVNKASEASSKSVEEMLGEPAFATVPEDPAVAEADRAGVASIDYAPTSPAVQAIEGMTDRLERTSISGRRAA